MCLGLSGLEDKVNTVGDMLKEMVRDIIQRKRAKRGGLNSA